MNTASHATTCQPLIDYFNRLIPLNAGEKQLIADRFHPHLFLKRHFVLQNGDVSTFYNFVVRGCLRMYQVDDKGVYHIHQFATENHWISDLASFHKQSPSLFNIEALEDTVVLRCTYEDLISLYLAAPKFDRIFRVLIENHVMNLHERIGQMFSSTAEERYESFLKTYPHLQSRLSQVQISAYLGITPEFLSRIRNRMAKGHT